MESEGKAGSEADRRFPCPSCGADLRFQPGEGRLLCDHCGHTEALASPPAASGAIPETAFRRGIEAELPAAETEEKRLSHCPNCGADIAFDPGLHAMECPFCATPVVADPGTRRQIRPKGVAPFLVTQDEAHQAMSRWLGSLWFAPSGLVDYARKGRRLEGIYLPFWTFDARTRSDYTGRRGTVYYTERPVTVRDQAGRTRTEMRREQQIRWMPVSGRVARDFDDVLVAASRSMPASHGAALAPWDLTRLEPYQPEYLAGFRSETYSVTLDEGMDEARAVMDRTIERDIRFDIGGDRQQITSVDTEVSGVTFKHVLLPAWTAAYRFRGRSFSFVVNAQTGKVSGDRPWSGVKIAAAVGLLALVIGAGLWIGQDPDRALATLRGLIGR
ncbi:primosomal protein N' (replication factor Y) - superfamily II helicase [Frigidibacter sp. SD6-1]|uniref:primosomal protein N' (replication factor Y) - superfamily II helicase n=1 Tax=Frigidibacter sp. SD6-1 TaxID=3032581 RepID=UPI0024E02934|nr:primosomal protein N' (replication factor Y) - superfamily II helicase [Frigidibacter sp. SD6-1]